jgi:hypothetical protein
VEGAKVGYVRGLMPRSSWGIGAAVAEATAVVILNRTQSRVRWELWVSFFLTPGRQIEPRIFPAERHDHNLEGGEGNLLD